MIPVYGFGFRRWAEVGSFRMHNGIIWTDYWLDWLGDTAGFTTGYFTVGTGNGQGTAGDKVEGDPAVPAG